MDSSSHDSITFGKTRLNISISDLIIYEVLSFNISHKRRFKNLPELARKLPKAYIPPNINILSKELIYGIHKQKNKR